MKEAENSLFVYKSLEEERLISSLSASHLITKEQLLDIKKLYKQEVPYHNFLHALKVAESVLKLPRDTYNIIEVRSLFIAALFHDAGHKGVAEDLDEFRSLDMAFSGIIDFEEKYNYSGIDYSIVRKAIIGTVFKNRAKNSDNYAILLADLDVSTIGMDFPEFLYYCDFPISVEFGVDISKWIQDVNYFKFLVGVEKYIFRTEVLREVFPHSLKNIKEYLALGNKNIEELFHYWKENNITYEEFYNFYKNLEQ